MDFKTTKHHSRTESFEVLLKEQLRIVCGLYRQLCESEGTGLASSQIRSDTS